MWWKRPRRSRATKGKQPLSVLIANTRMRPRKTCSLCHTDKSCEEFDQSRYTTNQGKRSIRLESRCRECDSARKSKSWRLNLEKNRARSRQKHRANRERNNEQLRAYRAKNRPKVLLQRIVSQQKRMLSGYGGGRTEVRKITEEVLALARFGNQYFDAYSGQLIDHPVIDHIVPLSLGGDHSAGNVCITSRSNNASKGRTPLLLWMLRRCA